jgi:hypothetical protein
MSFQIVWTLDGDIHARIADARQDSHNPLFMDIFAAAAWELWKTRNALIFDGLQPSVFRFGP